jgi:predicted nucleic acid-binding Zn ribbon protein
MNSTGVAVSEEQRRRVRRSALLWALVAAAFYLGFIVMAILRGVK